MVKIDMEVEHTAGRSLELKVEHPRGFKGFKVTRDEDKAEVEWDGRKLGKGEFSLTERRFQVGNSLAVLAIFHTFDNFLTSLGNF